MNDESRQLEAIKRLHKKRRFWEIRAERLGSMKKQAAEVVKEISGQIEQQLAEEHQPLFDGQGTPLSKLFLNESLERDLREHFDTVEELIHTAKDQIERENGPMEGLCNGSTECLELMFALDQFESFKDESEMDTGFIAAMYGFSMFGQVEDWKKTHLETLDLTASTLDILQLSCHARTIGEVLPLVRGEALKDHLLSAEEADRVCRAILNYRDAVPERDEDEAEELEPFEAGEEPAPKKRRVRKPKEKPEPEELETANEL